MLVFHLVKGEVEMKCSKAVKMNKMSRLAYLSVVTLMAFSLSGTRLLAADDFKMWHLAVGDAKVSALEHLEKSEDKDAAAKLISDSKHGEFAKKFAKEPFKFVEGVKEAWLVAKEKKTSIEDFKKSVLDGFKKVEAKEFGTESKKTAFLDLLNKLFEKGFKSDTLLKDLFTDTDVALLWASLGITDKKAEEKKDEPKKDEPKKDVKPPVLPPVGEVDDSALRRTAQAICDQANAAKSALEKQFADQIKPIKDALAELFNKNQETPAINPALLNQKKNDKGIDDVLPGLLANALQQEEKNNDVQPANTNQQPFPLNNNRNDRETDPNALNQPLPEPLPPQQSGFNPYMMGNMMSPGTQVTPRLDLPTDSGRQALVDAQDVADANDMRQPVDATLSPNAGLPELVMAKSKLKTDIQKTSIALRDAKDKASRLDEELESLKDGARAALSPEAKRRQAQLEADINSKKSEMQNLQQSLMMLPPEQRDQAGQMFQMKQMEVSKLEQERNQFTAQVDAAIETGNAEIKRLKKRSENLNSAAKKLEGQLQGMKTDETSLTQLINTNIQMQQAQMGPQTPAVQNVNNGSRLQNFGPRTQAPGRLGGTLSNVPTSATGGVTRGPLAK
jgi:hypothetical protein